MESRLDRAGVVLAAVAFLAVLPTDGVFRTVLVVIGTASGAMVAVRLARAWLATRRATRKPAAAKRPVTGRHRQKRSRRRDRAV